MPERKIQYTLAQANEFRELIQRMAGIYLDPGEPSLMDRQMKAVARALEVDSAGDLLRKARMASTTVRNKILNAVTTRETHWFRDPGFAEILRDEVFPKIIQQAQDAGRSKIKIWSAASSSGQEAYSVAILLSEMDAIGKLGRYSRKDFEILGTDIAPDALQAARDAVYDSTAMARGMPATLKQRYFEPAGSRLRVKKEQREMCRFEPRNLMELSPIREDWDLILIRNVLIYFQPPAKKTILERLTNKLRSDGYLLVGGCEDASLYTSVLRRKDSHGLAYYQAA